MNWEKIWSAIRGIRLVDIVPSINIQFFNLIFFLGAYNGDQTLDDTSVVQFLGLVWIAPTEIIPILSVSVHWLYDGAPMFGLEILPRPNAHCFWLSPRAGCDCGTHDDKTF